MDAFVVRKRTTQDVPDTPSKQHRTGERSVSTLESDTKCGEKDGRKVSYESRREHNRVHADENDETKKIGKNQLEHHRIYGNEDDPGEASSPLTETKLHWKKIEGENLDCDYVQLYTRAEADELIQRCERQLDYNTGKQAQVHIFGKWHTISRKQVAHGDTGLTYTFSNNRIPARPWTPLLTEIRDNISRLTGHEFNFVLINRYKDGNDHIGAHRDDEDDLVSKAPIASLSLGQPRDFVFRHADSRGKSASRQISPVTVELQHGSLLLMNYPTNTYWYHSLPKRKRAAFLRINMTFRQMVVKQIV
ncbi:DNA oxidative demethylase ALKBH2-like [Saccoglossus kowalevskii]|uniref:Alpha-ketoglutarate-dependent dioxygenase alkB homolog 2-like n=1 Tax=Saccoglossus kowalevskii TaxID=10224 RepID=A0ABM0N044_SACKO|nr:PREDICTED: alpha-ketoglutarate-dependent dioxygenase alkB homolog 2-like [Saccoglossus kowalevskii]